MNETEFHRVANETLEKFSDALEPADAAGKLTAELEDGALTIAFSSGRPLLVSKHTAMRQLWLSSPISGGLHFSYSEEGRWQLVDGRVLAEVLAAEVLQLSDAEVVFA